MSHVLHLLLSRTLDFYLREWLITSSGFLISSFLSRSIFLASLLWTLSGGHVGFTVFFFLLSSQQGKMTLKSNKNEPAVILEPVSSVRTALSDLYLEQLLQNKPKSDKVRLSFFFSFYLFIFNAPTTPPQDFAVHVCFREAEMGHMTVVCSLTRSLKIDPVVFLYFFFFRLNMLISKTKNCACRSVFFAVLLSVGRSVSAGIH